MNLIDDKEMNMPIRRKNQSTQYKQKFEGMVKGKEVVGDPGGVDDVYSSLSAW